MKRFWHIASYVYAAFYPNYRILPECGRINCYPDSVDRVYTTPSESGQEIKLHAELIRHRIPSRNYI